MEAELGQVIKTGDPCKGWRSMRLTLLDWIRDHQGYRKYVAIAGKCWLHSRHSLALFHAM